MDDKCNQSDDKKTWKCPICGNNAYRRIKGPPLKAIKYGPEGDVTGETSYRFEVHMECRGCSVLFRDPSKFHDDVINNTWEPNNGFPIFIDQCCPQTTGIHPDHMHMPDQPILAPVPPPEWEPVTLETSIDWIDNTIKIKGTDDEPT